MKSRRSKSSSGDIRAPRDENLPMERLGWQHAFAEIGIVDRHVAPAQNLLALGADRVLDDLHRARTRLVLAREEILAHCIMAGLRQREAELRAFLREEAMRDLQQHAATVTGLRVRAHRATMVEVREDRQAMPDDRVALAVLDIRHEADTAGILLVAGIIKTLRRGQTRIARDNQLRRIHKGARRRGARFGGAPSRLPELHAIHLFVAPGHSHAPFHLWAGSCAPPDAVFRSRLNFT